MKKAIIILACVLVSGLSASAQFGINNDNSDPDNSAMLDVKSTTKGVLLPRMTYGEATLLLWLISHRALLNCQNQKHRY